MLYAAQNTLKFGLYFFNFIQFLRIAAAQILELRPLTFSERWVVVSCPKTLLIIRSPSSSSGFVRTSH